MVVDFKRKIFLYLNSMHKIPPGYFIDRLVSFITTQYGAQKYKWDEWSMYSPQDIPAQHLDSTSDGGNCGVHVCVWGYIITHSVHIEFRERDMQYARKGIARLLKNFIPSKQDVTKRIKIRSRRLPKTRQTYSTELKIIYPY